MSDEDTLPPDTDDEPEVALCEHPLQNRAVTCTRQAIGEFEIPDNYDAGCKARPDYKLAKISQLCRQHAVRLVAFQRGIPVRLNTHEAMCKICQHPRAPQLIDRWLAWLVTTRELISELGVTYDAWVRHAAHTKLMEKKAAERSTRQALVMAAEEGLSVGDHNVRSGLAALQMLEKQREGNAPAVNVHLHQHKLTTLTDEQLAAEAEKVVRELRGEIQGEEEQAITLPETEYEEIVVD